MPKLKLSDKALQNVHKFVFLANEYPGKTIRELGELFMMSPIEINAAIWRAKELGLLFVDDQTGYFKVEEVPEKWEFGPEAEELQATILYVLQKLAETEQDIEESQFSSWTVGQLSHEVAIALKKLIADSKVAFYEITDVDENKPSKKGLKRGKKPKTIESTYTFYTLSENVKQEWGRKQFKDQTKLK